MHGHLFFRHSYIAVIISFIFFSEAFINVETSSVIAPDPVEDWVKIQNWELAKDYTSNNTLYNFLTGEELSDCFQMYSKPNIMKFRCYSRYNIFEMTTLFCIGLRDGYICM